MENFFYPDQILSFRREVHLFSSGDIEPKLDYGPYVDFNQRELYVRLLSTLSFYRARCDILPLFPSLGNSLDFIRQVLLKTLPKMRCQPPLSEMIVSEQPWY